LGDIVVGDICDIDQPQCHKCTKKQKISWKRKKTDTCDIVVDQCHNVTNHDVTQVLSNFLYCVKYLHQNIRVSKSVAW